MEGNLAKKSAKKAAAPAEGSKLRIRIRAYEHKILMNFAYDSTGYVEIWKDGVKVVNYQGPTGYNSPQNPFLKFGIYKWPWDNGGTSDVSSRTVYHDAIRAYFGPNGYDKVAPR